MAGDLDLKQLWRQVHGVDLPEGLASPFNGCMHREYCRRLEPLAADAERWAKEANRADDLASAWAAACAFIDAHVGDPDMTDEMVRTYAEFQRWREHLKTHNVNSTADPAA